MIAPHVDVRGCGGYVVAPGSYVVSDHKPGGWYVIGDWRPPEPLPEWLADLASPPAATALHDRRRVRAAAGRHLNISASPRRRLRGLLASVVDAPPGTRNSVLFWAACRAAEMAGEDLLDWDGAMSAMEQAGVAAGLGEIEARMTVKSAFTRSRR